MYPMVGVGLRVEIAGDCFHLLIDSSWIVNAVDIEDARVFRCDILNEIVEWNIGSDGRLIEFTMRLDDIWSQILLTLDKKDAWWNRQQHEKKRKWMGTLPSNKDTYNVLLVLIESV